MTSLWFVTPAYLRFGLSEVCFEQRRRVIETLARHDIEACCVVVADDDNLDIARSKGFDVVERDNTYLGRKFNDGMEYAGKHGADFIVPIGSDSWIDPAFFLPLVTDGAVLSSRLYAVADADRLAELRIDTQSGVGPYVFPRALLQRSGFRPAEDQLARGIDSSTIRGIERRHRIRWQHRDLHPLQYIGLRGVPRINSYDALKDRWGVSEYLNPWPRLAQHYGQELADAAEKVLRPDTPAPERKRVLILSMGEDTNGNGWRLRSGLQRHTDLHVDAISMRTSRQKHPEQVPGSRRKRRQIAERLYDQAAAVHLFNSLDGWQELDQRDSRRRCKPILLHHHGVAFRREHDTLARGARNIGALQVASTLDLTLLQPDVEWLPAIYNLDELRAIRERQWQPGRPLRIAHAPTYRNVKGTEHVLATMKELGNAVEFDLIEGVRWSDCLARLARADILVDQFKFGVGSLAVEAWAMGIPVVAGVEDIAVRTEMLRRWKRLPFVEAHPGVLSRVLRRLTGSDDARREAAARGEQHVRRWHAEDKVAAQLVELYDRLQPTRYPVTQWRGVKPWRRGTAAGSMYGVRRRDTAA